MASSSESDLETGNSPVSTPSSAFVADVDCVKAAAKGRKPSRADTFLGRGTPVTFRGLNYSVVNAQNKKETIKASGSGGGGREGRLAVRPRLPL
jgi:hypothetical protein